MNYFIFFLIIFTYKVEAKIIIKQSKNTITPVEMNIGDTLEFTLRNGENRMLILQSIDADIVITNLSELKTFQPNGGTVYSFSCEITIDGHLMPMKRFVGTQESFYEPYVINGMRIWFDGVNKIENLISDNHGGYESGAIPKKDARFIITDMNDDIAPVKLFPPYINNNNFIDIADCYNGDDCWMGAYSGVELHGGLDVNQPKGSPNFTPFPIDTHYLYNSLARGDNNNRWRGIHKWENGDIWIFQNAHVLNLLKNETSGIDKGTHFADCCGVHIGDHSHAHYIFRIVDSEDEEYYIDPWILFWQIFNDNKKKNQELIASMAPFSPGKSGTPIHFFSSCSGDFNNNNFYYWDFGDGGVSFEENPIYSFSKPGIYPVTIIVDNGVSKSSFTQHITIDGNEISEPSLILINTEEPSFRRRPLEVMDVYGSSNFLCPNSLQFLARDTRPKPDAKFIEIQNIGGGNLKRIEPPKIVYRNNAAGWLDVEVMINEDGNQTLRISPDGSGLSFGLYSAVIEVESFDAINFKQHVLVELNIPSYPPSHKELGNLHQEIIDNEDVRYGRFYATPYFWVGPRFKKWKEKGFNDFYLTNGGRSVEGEFVRFRPDLEEGKYEVSFTKETPFDPARRAMTDTEQFSVDPNLNPIPKFKVLIHSKTGNTIKWMEPTKSLIIGQFEFLEGMDSYVDILSEGSVGQVLIDAVKFKRIE